MIAAGGSGDRVVARTSRSDDPSTARRSITMPSRSATGSQSASPAYAIPATARATRSHGVIGPEASARARGPPGFALRMRACFGYSLMRIINPATGEVLREVAEADRAAVAAACRRARAAQRAWAATSLGARCDPIRRFRELAVERAEPLARTLALEGGKPIAQARRELARLLPRLDFFLGQGEGV